MPTYDEYWEAVQHKICVKCLDGDGVGGCRIGKGEMCALEAYFPTVISVINSVYSHSIIPYEEELRRRVCSVCRNQSGEGLCHVREQVECSLDRYFPLLVEVIEDTQRRAQQVGERGVL